MIKIKKLLSTKKGISVPIPNQEIAMYKQLPSTKQLVELFILPKEESGTDKMNRALLILMACGCCIFLVSWGLVKWNLAAQLMLAYVNLSWMALAMLFWIATILFDMYKNMGIFRNPAEEVAGQFDRNFAQESNYLLKFRAIPNHILVGRYQSLDLQLQRWEKSLETARLVGLLGPPLILISKQFTSGFGTTWIETMMAAAFTGILIGTVIKRTGMDRLRRVSHLLKRASELHNRCPRARESKKRR